LRDPTPWLEGELLLTIGLGGNGDAGARRAISDAEVGRSA
jgi:hypothetical protein